MAAQEPRPGDSNSSPHWLPYALFLGASLVAIALVGYLLLARMDRVAQRLEAVDGRLGEVSEEMREVRHTSEQARLRAEEAELYARTSAEGRERAEVSRDLFEQRARQAEQTAAELGENLEQTREELEVLRRERAAEMNRLQRALSRIAETRRTREGVVMNLDSETIKFDFDQAEIKPEYREVLSRIAGILLTSSGYRLQIYGHTDDVGSTAYNQTLSERRAAAVRDYLVEAGIEPQIISIKGFGKSNPLVEGTSTEARARNRRVEIGIVDTVVSYERVEP